LLHDIYFVSFDVEGAARKYWLLMIFLPIYRRDIIPVIDIGIFTFGMAWCRRYDSWRLPFLSVPVAVNSINWIVALDSKFLSACLNHVVLLSGLKNDGILFMDPLKHMSLLREIGVDWYTTRVALAMNPSGLDTVHLTRADEVKSQMESHGVSYEAESASVKVKPIIDFGLDAPKNRQVPEHLAVSPSKAAPLLKAVIVPFDLLVVSGVSIVFIIDVKTSPLSAVWERSVRQFFGEIELACDFNEEKLQSLDYFSWPIAGRANSNLGEDQLIQLLAGFMRQRISGDVKGVILFGDNAKQYSTSVVSSINKAQVITAPGLGEMFASFSAKASLWKDLQLLTAGNS
jgi:hypothetical protein